MRKIKINRFTKSVPGLITVACLLLALVGGVVYTSVAQAASDRVSGKHMVTIHDNGQDRGVLTSATTLREALQDANIILDPNDTVEPGLDEPLVDRNYDVNIYRARPITVVDGNMRVKIMTPHRTARQIVADANMTLHDEDITTQARAANMVSEGTGVVLTIDRATPFTLVLYGKTIKAYTQATTVGDMLAGKGIHLAKNDTVSVDKSSPIVANMRVELWRNGVQTVNQDEDVAFDIKQTEDPNRPVGYKKITTPGVKGKKTVTYEIVMKNGKEVSRKEIQTVVTKQPQAQEEIIGTKNNYSGSLNEWLIALRQCESGGNYQINTGNGYYGAYQFSKTTWDSLNTGYDYAYQAPPHVQDAMIIVNTNRTAGLKTQNPGCYEKLGLSNYPPGS